MCQNKTDSQNPLSGACANVHGQATAQLQLSNQSPVMCQLGISVMMTSIRYNTMTESVMPLASNVLKVPAHGRCPSFKRAVHHHFNASRGAASRRTVRLPS